MKKDKLLIFDLDGTLYRFEGGTFENSGLQKIILQNALKFIQVKLQKSIRESKSILQEIQKDYGEDISIAVEEQYSYSRKKYFDFVWDVDAKGIIKTNKQLRDVLERLSKEYQLLLVSDAAEIWIRNALKELDLENIFGNNILSGDGKKRKSKYNRFDEIAQVYNFVPQDIISIGDQEKTDIIPAKKCGFKTVHISKNKSQYADINIQSINSIEDAINKIIKLSSVEII